MNDDQFLLASAYLDGELTADERASAEADPDVMSEVERLRAVQSDVRTVAAPSEAAREAAISAAMAQFRAAPAAATAPPPRTVQFRPPPWYRRYLAVAAAVVAVGLLGVVVVNVGRTSDDDSASISADDAGNDAADEAIDQPTADFDQRDRVELQGGDSEAAGDMADDGDAAAVEPEMAATIPAAADDSFEDLAADAEAADDMAADDGDDMADDSDQVDELPPGAIPVTSAIGAVDPALLPDEAALVAIGDELLSRLAVGEAPATPNTVCAFPDLENPAEILVRTSFETEAGPIELLVAVDELDRVVSAIDPESCAILVSARLP